MAAKPVENGSLDDVEIVNEARIDMYLYGSRLTRRFFLSPLFKSPCPYRAPQDGSPEVATGHHVMDRAGIFDPQRSGHGPIKSHGARPENRKPDLIPRSPIQGRWRRYNSCCESLSWLERVMNCSPVFPGVFGMKAARNRPAEVPKRRNPCVFRHYSS